MDHILRQGHPRARVVSDRLGPAPARGVRPLSAVDPVGDLYLRERLAGYREAITAAGLDASQVNLVEATNIHMDSGMAAAAQLIVAAERTADRRHLRCACRRLEGAQSRTHLGT
jgi:DNA-binding LacI/PurR family transcriptional regulator